jgi:RES domain-containing protein
MHGGRWNSPGVEVIYATGTESLAVLEILVHYDVLPRDYALTRIQIPEHVGIEQLLTLPPGWDSLVPNADAQAEGDKWVREARSAVLSVPSRVIGSERNFIINPLHPQFSAIVFDSPVPYKFDPRLK